MARPKQMDLVSFRCHRPTWLKFLAACRSKDRSASAVLRNYVDLIASNKFQILDPPAIQFRASTEPGPHDP